MNAPEIYESCRENPNYTLCNNISNSEFNSLLFWNIDIKDIIQTLAIYKINYAPEVEEAQRRKENEHGLEKIKRLFHGPLYQNLCCEFDVQLKRCQGHQEPMVLTTVEAFYVNMNGIGANPANRGFGYVLYGKVIVNQTLERDPEDNVDFSEHFLNYDMIHDYGNKKLLRLIEDFFPTHIIFYNRKHNSRLTEPGYRPYEIEMLNPLPPPAIYENVPLEETLLNDVFQCDEYRRDIQVISVQKIVNPILEDYYNRVKENFGPEDEVQIERVFHGLPFERVDAVARFNLDWRKCQYGKYGWGIHFGRYPHNAKYFPYKYPSGPSRKRCMLAFDILCRHRSSHDYTDINNLTTPPQIMDVIIDTVEVPQNGSLIKFNDHEFMPRFKIIYYDIWEH